MQFPPPVFDSLRLPHAAPEQMDALWARGWRHFGGDFFRYSLSLGDDGGVQFIQPLRMDLAAFQISKSQRRVLRRNADTDARVAPAVVDDEREAMFLRHRARFVTNIPESLRTFIPADQPDKEPCPCVSVEVRTTGRLIAVSYLDVGAEAVSSVYAMFEPDESWRSLGTFTLLHEIQWAAAQGKRWLYPGYATAQPSHYDYKKSFRPLQCYDWRGHWLPLESPR
jgi:arginyl-tRNA--protein-N-Asp/Glu arginylyltransferase